MTRYLGITMGPILRSLMMGVRPKELFTASYMHSLLSKEAIRTLDTIGWSIISPAFDLSASPVGVGMYPDRIFVKYGSGVAPADMKKLRDRIMDTFIEKLEVKDVERQSFIKAYFKIYMAEVEREKDSEAVNDLNLMLDELELNNVFPAEDCKGSNVIEDLIVNPVDNPVWKDAFNKDSFVFAEKQGGRLVPFPDLKKIALNKKNGVSKSYQKYVCVVQADGDNMGKIVGNVDQLGDGLGIQQVSSDIFDFCKVATHIIRTGHFDAATFSANSKKYLDSISASNKDCVGLPIYAGGDDLLFVAPVVYEDGQGQVNTIFDLLNHLDAAYSMIVAKKRTVTVDQEAYSTHLSYGISIAYYKRPLYESLEDARNQLFCVAKEAYNRHKNCIAWKLTKHSGSSHYGVLPKDSGLYDRFKDLLKFRAEDGMPDSSAEIVTAVCHKIRNAANLIPVFAASDRAMMSLRLQAFFDNILDTDEDMSNKDEYIVAVKELMLALWNEQTPDLAAVSYDLLRTGRFICGWDELHEN